MGLEQQLLNEKGINIIEFLSKFSSFGYETEFF